VKWASRFAGAILEDISFITIFVMTISFYTEGVAWASIHTASNT
jgi:hypothetical protein